MSLPRSADGVSAADARRLVRPTTYLAVLSEVRAAFDTDRAEAGVDLVHVAAGLPGRPRALASWSWTHDMSKLAGGMLGEAMRALEMAPAKFRSAIPQRGLFAHGFQRWYLSLGL